MSKPDLDKLETRFWAWRVRGRLGQTLHQDAEFFLTAWQHQAGWQMCGELYKRIMAKQDWDIEQGGRPPSPPESLRLPPRPRRKKGGIIVYG